MTRPITLFTGQWADLPLAELAPLAKSMGYDGLELACWGDHFDIQQALASDSYVRDKRALLEKHGLQCFALGCHLVGQAVCDLIDERHQSIVPPHVWGDGDPEGVRQRAAQEMEDCARAAAKFGVVNGTVTNDLHGRGIFTATIRGETYSGEATRDASRARSGIANGAGSRGGWMRCSYQMNSATLGTGQCELDNGARFTMHLGG